MNKYSRMHLFQGYGVELEYMIVDRDTLNVRPIADKLMKQMTGRYVEDYVNGPVTWSNELVMHVIELKCTEPTKDLVQLNKDFEDNIVLINDVLKNFNARLLPTAAHPWMNPEKETFLWPHGNSAVYERYDAIFGCKGHGWSNLQSTHLNLPFYDDEEFAKLHAATRIVLPLIPAIAASSPILDMEYTGVLDKRLVYYSENQKRIPSILGKVIPEKVNSKRQYHKLIYDKIEQDIKPFNYDNILDPVWVNSRGAIARFDRGSLEIRLTDIQECPMADLAIVSLVVNVIKMLASEWLSSNEKQQAIDTDSLAAMLKGTIKRGGGYIISDANFLGALGISSPEMSAIEVWKHLLFKVSKAYPDEITPWIPALELILNEGNLSKRILGVLNTIYTPTNLKMVYQELSDDLASNQQFVKKNETIPYSN